MVATRSNKSRVVVVGLVGFFVSHMIVCHLLVNASSASSSTRSTVVRWSIRTPSNKNNTHAAGSGFISPPLCRRRHSASRASLSGSSSSRQGMNVRVPSKNTLTGSNTKTISTTGGSTTFKSAAVSSSSLLSVSPLPVWLLSAATTTTTTTTTRRAIAWAVMHIALGSAATPLVARATRTWYRKLELPSWTPPNRVFCPVWTVLYASMGVAMSLALPRPWIRSWSLSPPTVATATTASSSSSPVLLASWWLLHLCLNLSWAPIFFGAMRLRLALAVNYAMLATLLGGILPRIQNQAAFGCLVPYAVWLVYATALNQAICRHNPVFTTDTGGAYNNAKFQKDLLDLQNQAAQKAGLPLYRWM